MELGRDGAILLWDSGVYLLEAFIYWRHYVRFIISEDDILQQLKHITSHFHHV